ncbi:hypothetical protein T484DRAFT_1911209 [Baffinella frigidus]|nr:hypothetical protein T484DRAFT_1911209 [Cryptophyta sp. CCMP2293]
MEAAIALTHGLLDGEEGVPSFLPEKSVASEADRGACREAAASLDADSIASLLPRGAGGSEAETAKALEKVWLTSSVTCHGITADNPGTSCEAAKVRLSVRLVGNMKAAEVEAILRSRLQERLQGIDKALTVTLEIISAADAVYAPADAAHSSHTSALAALSAVAPPPAPPPLVSWEAASLPAAGILASKLRLPVAILASYAGEGWRELGERRGEGEYQEAVRFFSVFLHRLARASSLE